ncbi:hypothetical protein [Streptomyces sp. 8K308]|uniref:hypothetical protein n=1 Tax=Streptomyces sp. 8K308 TaxID=2530388 RepID=UPI001A9EA648|nr:hypothetical protein [Streptomyces sp. 8K308]
MGSDTQKEGAGVFACVGMCAAVGGTVRTWRDHLAAVEEPVRSCTDQEIRGSRASSPRRHRALIAVAEGDGCYLLKMAEQLQTLPDPETAGHHCARHPPL